MFTVTASFLLLITLFSLALFDCFTFRAILLPYIFAFYIATCSIADFYLLSTYFSPYYRIFCPFN